MKDWFFFCCCVNFGWKDCHNSASSVPSKTENDWVIVVPIYLNIAQDYSGKKSAASFDTLLELLCFKHFPTELKKKFVVNFVLQKNHLLFRINKYHTDSLQTELRCVSICYFIHLDKIWPQSWSLCVQPQRKKWCSIFL